MQGAVAVFRDVTREKAAQQDLASASADLRRKAEQLERSNEDLEHFAYVASHDLKEPLRMVTSYVQLLERRYRNALDDDAREYIGFAVDGARRMSRLLDDLLKYYRSGKQNRPLTDVDCGLLLSNVRENLEPWLRETKALLTNDPLPIVRGDPGQLRQLFHNLIDNALKYCGPRPPEIHVSASRREGEWLFSVRDNGAGIDRVAKDRLFTIFQPRPARRMAERPESGSRSAAASSPDTAAESGSSPIPKADRPSSSRCRARLRMPSRYRR